MIFATGTEYFTTRIEDGIALAGAVLRAEFADCYPDARGPIETKLTFMADALGIPYTPRCFSFSNIPRTRHRSFCPETS